MSSEAFKRIEQRLKEALAYAQGAREGYVVHEVEGARARSSRHPRTHGVVAGGVCPLYWGEEGDVVELGTGAAQTGRPGDGVAGVDRQGAGNCAAGVGGRVRFL